MKRVAHTIVLNGLHHLLHDNHAESIASKFDHWVICEGAAGNEGPSSWRPPMEPFFHMNGSSVDGTLEYLKDLQKKYPSIILITPENGKIWPSKTAMVNKCFDAVRPLIGNEACWMWQIDVDEFMSAEDRLEVEKNATTNSVAFYYHHRIGEREARGAWGGNAKLRLWKWKGEKCINHSACKMDGRWITSIANRKFVHMSYCHDLDVIFKDRMYTGYRGLYTRWTKLLSNRVPVLPLTELFGEEPDSSFVAKRVGRTSLVLTSTEQKVKPPAKPLPPFVKVPAASPVANTSAVITEPIQDIPPVTKISRIIDPVEEVVLPEPPPEPQVQISAPNGKKLLFIINGGLGDAASLTHTLFAAHALGYDVHVSALRGNASLMQQIWTKVSWLHYLTLEEARKISFEAVLCSTRADVLRERAEGLTYKKLIHGDPTRKVLLAETYKILLEQLGHSDVKLPYAPLASLLPVARKEQILIAPGTKNVDVSREKKYNNWLEAIRYMARPITIIGDAGANEPWITQAVQLKDVKSLIGRTSVEELIGLFSKAQVVYAVDNGIGHLAACFGVPTVSVFNGKTDPKLFAPYGKNAVVITDLRPGVVANGYHDIILGKNGVKPSWEGDPIIVGKKLSVIITTHNEGDEVFLTCDNVKKNAGCDVEIIVVDDASTDGSCDSLPDYVKVIRRKVKTGVASSRNMGVQNATGDAFMFLDAHMRVSPGTPGRMMKAAFEKNALIVPGVIPLYNPNRSGSWACVWSLDGNRLRSKWHGGRPKQEFTATESFVAPGWVLTRESWDKMGPWPYSLHNWGSTEVCKGIQAHMAGVPLLAMRDAETWHRFRSRFPYHVSPAGIWFNAYVVARLMFGKEVFEKFFLPKMKSAHWDSKIENWLKSSEMQDEDKRCSALRTADPMKFVDTFITRRLKSDQRADAQQVIPEEVLKALTETNQDPAETAPPVSDPVKVPEPVKVQELVRTPKPVPPPPSVQAAAQNGTAPVQKKPCSSCQKRAAAEAAKAKAKAEAEAAAKKAAEIKAAETREVDASGTTPALVPVPSPSTPVLASPPGMIKSPRPPCPNCTRKHLAQAIALLNEAQNGYPAHRWLAIGHIAEASDEILGLYPDIAARLRTIRKIIETGGEPGTSVYDIIVEITDKEDKKG